MRYLLIGIKGTGMSHLASYLVEQGDEVIGLDRAEDFFTSAILSGITVLPLDSHLPSTIDKVIFSTAYERRSVPAIEEARERNLVCISYPEALRELSLSRVTAGVSGTHGKTTTTSIAAYLMETIGESGGAVYGSYLKGHSSVYHRGDRSLVIEACEYQEHFLLYDLDILVITNMDFDHPDYFRNLEAVEEAFHRRFIAMKNNSLVIAHSSTIDIVSEWMKEREDIKVVFYGKGTDIDIIEMEDGIHLFGRKLETREKSRAIIEDYIAGTLVAAALSLADFEDTPLLSRKAKELVPLLSGYPGVAARGEKVREKDGILYLDEYAHHPREIAVSIENIRLKYPGRRVVVLFMPHTSSRTEALMDDFAISLSMADLLFLQSVYSSARNDEGSRDSSRALIERIREREDSERYQYIPDPLECAARVASSLKTNDVCITMGAGDNRDLIEKIIELKEIV